VSGYASHVGPIPQETGFKRGVNFLYRR